MVLNQIVIHISLFSMFLCMPFCINSFSKLTKDSPTLLSFQQYANTPIGIKATNSPPSTPYQIAQRIQQDFFHLINQGSYLVYHGKRISLTQKQKIEIEDLILLLTNEFTILNEDIEELINKITTVESSKEVKVVSRKTDQTFSFNSTRVHQQSSKQTNQINTELDFDYVKDDHLKGDIKISSSSSRNLTKHSQRARNKSELDIEELSVTWKPKTNIKKVQAGKYRQHIGLGLAQSTTVEGVEVEKLYHDYNIKLGYHDGLFASLTTPHFLDIPFTFYSIQRSNKQNNLTNATHSGLYFKKSYKALNLHSEVSEYQDHSQFNGYGNANKDSAFSMRVNYSVSPKLTFGSSITHLGQNFNTRQKNTNLHDFNQGNNQSLQKELYYSLSGYFGSSLGSVSGISDFKLNMNLNIDQRNRVSLVYDQIYDHSNDRRNTDNGLGLTTLYLTHQTKHEYTVQLSMQHIDFASNGISNRGFLQNQARSDGSLFRSSIQYTF